MTQLPMRRLAALMAALMAAPALAAPLLPLAADQRAKSRMNAPRHAEALRSFALRQSAMGPLDDLRLLGIEGDGYGKTHAHFQQYHRGLPVWGAYAVTHREVDGRQSSQSEALRRNVTLSAEVPALSRDKALEIAQKRFRPRDATHAFLPDQAELVVFPTEFASSLSLRRSAKSRGFELDPYRGSLVARPQASYALAYHVKLFFSSRSGFSATEAMVDASTGQVLRAWDALEYAATPSQGTGHSQYSGDVTLSTTQLDNGEYRLWDTTRPLLEHPLAGPDPMTQIPEMIGAGNRVFFPDLTNYLGTNYASFDNTWGNGQAVQNLFDQNPDWTTPTAQTAAVDAAYGLQRTWDFYKAIFDRDGVDGAGSSTFAVVHLQSIFGSWLNAAWIPSAFGMIYGDGAYTDYPYGPSNRYSTLTQLDITAHELSHGVMGATARLVYEGESGGLNEANSDIMGTMTEFWVRGAGGTGSTIPDTGGNWTIGEQFVPAGDPLGLKRTMYRPSLDGLSHDAWFDGLDLEEVHLSSGVGNRFFYFLAQGTDKADPDKQSRYLPAGMAGIGNDKAARIWYRTMASFIVNVRSSYHDIRGYMLQTARELHGEGSSEVAAVENAWAAVNVGPAHGAAEPLRVRIPQQDQNLAYNTTPRVWVLPAGGHEVQLTANVTNAKSEPGVRWALGGLWQYGQPAGSLSSEGVYRTPLQGHSGFGLPVTSVKASSVEDPSQFAVGLVLTVDSDLDLDHESDACDLGLIATTWNSEDSYQRQAADVDGSGTVDTSDVLLFLLAFLNVFGK